jgi:hypothetical protein
MYYLDNGKFVIFSEISEEYICCMNPDRNEKKYSRFINPLEELTQVKQAN